MSAIQLTGRARRVVANGSWGRRGMKLAYARTPWREAEVPSSIRVLYEDEHMMAVYKPSGLQVGVAPQAGRAERL